MSSKNNNIPFQLSANYSQLVGKIAVVVISVLLFFSCQTKVSTDIPPDLLNNSKSITMDAVNFETVYSDSGVVKYHLKTPRLLTYDDPKLRYQDFPEGFLLQRYDLNRKIISQMSGNHGKYYEIEKRWEAFGNVILVNSQGDTLKSEELKYQQAEDMIYSDKFVSIKKGDQTIFGNGGFKSDTQMTKWSFLKTTGHLYVEGE